MGEMKKYAFIVLSFIVVILSCTSDLPSGADVCWNVQPITISRPAPRLLLTPSFLARLKARAAANEPAWVALKSRCDQYATGTVYAPNGNEYPPFPSIGAGYQGEEYLPAIMTLGLCYQVGGLASHGAKGAELLNAMSLPQASGGANPATDSGYGIRNYGVGMAFGYDWLYPALSQATKDQVVTTLNAWIGWYDSSGFIRNHPIGNYFAGYWLAKVAGALATEGENAQAAAQLTDVETRMWGQLVKPYFQRDMAGGGWPEGWQYGPRSVTNTVLGLWAIKTAKDVDWFSEVPQARDQALYLAHFTWPSMTRIDDQGTIRSGFTPTAPKSTAGVLATALGELGDSYASQARQFSAELGPPSQIWEAFMFYDSSLSTASYKGSISYYAAGAEHVSMRSSWSTDAVLGIFSAGQYINAPDSGEQMFNQGSLSVVVGGTPLLLNATGQIPQLAGNPGESAVYTDSWGGGGRKLYNVFYTANGANVYSPGQGTQGPTTASTHVEAFEEGTTYVRARGANLEQMYRSNVVTSWTRELTYIRPNTFVLMDRTSVPSGNTDQWLAFHSTSATNKVINVLPASRTIQDVSLLGGVTRREFHVAGTGASSLQWVSALSANTSPVERITSSDVVGVAVRDATNAVSVFGTSLPYSTAHYSYTQTQSAVHVLADIAPSSTGYSASATFNGNVASIAVVTGGELQRTPGGNLCFNVTISGVVSACQAVSPPPLPADAGTTDSGTIVTDSGPSPDASQPPPVDAGQDAGPVCYKIIRQ